MKHIVATQTQHNLDRLIAIGLPPARGVVLPMPMPDRECMQRPSGTGRGVLFIGRHEQRKNWSVFLDMLEKTGLPGKVLTNSKGYAKFVNDFSARGIQGQVQAELSGQAKADFIQSARVAFHPSQSESYGYCAMETLAAGLPTLCLEEYGWWRNFQDQGVTVATKRDAAATLLQLYNNPVAPVYDWHAHEAATRASWEAFLS